MHRLKELRSPSLPCNYYPHTESPKKAAYSQQTDYQYESTFRTKEILEQDRARFARAWFRYFNTYESRGGSTPKGAYNAWFEEINKRYPKHSFRLEIEDHPKFIIKKLRTLDDNQFGKSAFGLSDITKFKKKYYIKGLREKYLNPIIYKHNEQYYLNNG